MGTSQGPGVLSLCKSTTPGASMPFLQITPGPPPPLPWSLFPYFLECGWHLHCIFNPFESLHFFPLRHRPGKKSPSLDLIICSSVAELSSQSPRVKVLEPLHLQCQPCKAYSLNLILSLVLTRPCLAQSNCFSSSFLMFPVSKWPTCCCHLDLSLTVPSSSRTLLITWQSHPNLLVMRGLSRTEPPRAQPLEPKGQILKPRATIALLCASVSPPLQKGKWYSLPQRVAKG